MNNSTKPALLNFIDKVDDFAYAVSSVAGTNALGRLFGASESLRKAIRNDETLTDQKSHERS